MKNVGSAAQNIRDLCWKEIHKNNVFYDRIFGIVRDKIANVARNKISQIRNPCCNQIWEIIE